jgi:3-hydroxyisobutyrate dehydrogenase-like beta-hydroxyacid dehydrogenase
MRAKQSRRDVLTGSMVGERTESLPEDDRRRHRERSGADAAVPGRGPTRVQRGLGRDRVRDPAGDAVFRIAVVGLGVMGGRIAGRLLAGGNDVFGTTRTRSKADGLIQRGLFWSDSPREAAEAADVVFSIVSDSDELQAVTGGPEGILAGLAAGKVYVDMSTVTPQTSRELAERVAARGASMLAAPFTGSVSAAEEGSLAIIVGGEVEAFERVEPILGQLGSTLTFVGDTGQALLLKLATNISLAVQVLAFSEGVRLAEQGGIERELALDVLTRSAIGSPILQTRVPLELPDKAWFDVHELLGAARVLGYEHPDIAVLFQMFSELVAAPDGREPGSGG